MENHFRVGKNLCLMCFKTFNDDHGKEKYICNECSSKLDLMQSAKIIMKDMKTQDAKADNGKPILSLVPKEIIFEIEKVRSFDVKKYKDPDNWKNVEIERYHQALLRHTLAVWDDVYSKDKESGILHLSHIACNVAFLLELMKDKE